MIQYIEVRDEINAMINTCEECQEYAFLEEKTKEGHMIINDNENKIEKIRSEKLKTLNDYTKLTLFKIMQVVVSGVLGLLVSYLVIGVLAIINKEIYMAVVIIFFVDLILIVFMFGKRKKAIEIKNDKGVVPIYYRLYSIAVVVYLVLYGLILYVYLYNNEGKGAFIFMWLLTGIFVVGIIMIFTALIFDVSVRFLNKIYVLLFFPVLKPQSMKYNNRIDRLIETVESRNNRIKNDISEIKKEMNRRREVLEQVTPIPIQYWKYAKTLCSYVMMKRANSLGEAINLLEANLYRDKMMQQMGNVDNSINSVNEQINTFGKNLDEFEKNLNNKIDNSVSDIKKTVRDNRPIINNYYRW